MSYPSLVIMEIGHAITPLCQRINGGIDIAITIEHYPLLNKMSREFSFLYKVSKHTVKMDIKD